MTARNLISKLHLTIAAPLCALTFAMSLSGHAALAQTSTMAPSSSISSSQMSSPSMSPSTMSSSSMSSTTMKTAKKTKPVTTEATDGSSMAATSSMGKKSRLSASDKFKSAAAAQASCPSDTVVWANLSSKVYHTSGSKYFGKTKHGAYACAMAVKGAGFKASKS